MDGISPETLRLSQADFMTCYRGRQSVLHHVSYMRMSKVLLALRLCEMAEIRLEGKDVFDYGFGAGTFFRYCPSSSRLFGVELDPENVSAVQTMLNRRGHTNTVLRLIDIDHWSKHPLLTLQYDVILCSHVLEHLPDPVNFLKIARRCLKDAGAFVGLVPINERKVDLHHLQVVNEETIRGWARDAGFSVQTYLEADPWLYWCQPMLASNTNRMRLITQAICLGIGIPATLLGPRLWSQLSRLYAALTASRPTQAGFVLTSTTG